MYIMIDSYFCSNFAIALIAKRIGDRTPDFLRTPLGSEAAIQPRRQPGMSHLFDIDPRVSTGVTDPKIPIGRNLLLPKTIWL